MEVLIGVYGTVLRRQVPDMPIGGHDLVVGAEVFVDRLRLGGRFDNDDVHKALESAKSAGSRRAAAAT